MRLKDSLRKLILSLKDLALQVFSILTRFLINMVDKEFLRVIVRQFASERKTKML